MELRVLKYFLAAAGEGNITRAAERLHITQPTLSRQLMQLEDELGVSLFRRGRHSLSLTEAGMLLKQRALEMTALEEKIYSDLSEPDGALTGIVSVGSGELKGMSLLAEQIAYFAKRNPAVGFKVYSGIADDIKLRIESGSVDIGLLTEPVDISEYDFIRLNKKERWGVMIGKDHPLAEKKSISPEGLTGIPIIMAQRGSVRNEIENWFGDYFKELKIAAACDLLYNTAALAKSGVGAAVSIEGDTADEGLVFIPLEPALETGSVIVWKKNREQSPAVREFIEQLKKALKTLDENR